MRCIILLWCLVFANSALAASNQPIEQFTLKNGMEVIVLPNHRVPAVNHMLWYKVGAADDPVGKSGLAHFHEHIMFKGSPKFAAGEFVRLMDKNGGEHNAFTGRDVTSYYVTIAKERLPLVMELEADRMRTITASDEDVKKERQVIIEERRQRIENSPEALLSEQMDAALFRHHPYRLPTIGWLHEMETLTKKDVLDFHARYYHPNNAVLIVSGDITAAEFKPLAEKYYGHLPKKNIPKRAWLAEPPQLGARSITLTHKHVKQSQLSRIYASESVTANKEQAYALFVLSHLLAGGKNSTLYQSLVVDQKLASEVRSGYDFYAHGPAQFSIDMMPEQGVSLETLEQALNAELKKFTVNADALARAKKLMQAESIYARDGLTGISNLMGWMVMAGLPPSEFNRWSDQIEAMDANAVEQAAQTLLNKNASVTGYLLPETNGPIPIHHL